MGRRHSEIIRLDDGTEMRVCGVRGEVSDADRAALQEVVDAARRKMAEDHPHWQEIRTATHVGDGVVLMLTCGHAVLRRPTFSTRALGTDCEDCAALAALKESTDG